MFKVLRAPSGAMELHLLHQEELLGREASLYSTSTVSHHLVEHISLVEHLLLLMVAAEERIESFHVLHHSISSNGTCDVTTLFGNHCRSSHHRD